MKTEMDALAMDELQRRAWLLANRATLMAVGLVWLGLIAWELSHGHRPWFLVAMVPTIAATRALFYRWYCSRG